MPAGATGDDQMCTKTGKWGPCLGKAFRRDRPPDPKQATAAGHDLCSHQGCEAGEAVLSDALERSAVAPCAATLCTASSCAAYAAALPSAFCLACALAKLSGSCEQCACACRLSTATCSIAMLHMLPTSALCKSQQLCACALPEYVAGTFCGRTTIHQAKGLCFQRVACSSSMLLSMFATPRHAQIDLRCQGAVSYFSQYRPYYQHCWIFCSNMKRRQCNPDLFTSTCESCA